MKFTIDKNQFLQGITYNPEFGMEDMYGCDLYRKYGYISGGFKTVDVTTGTISTTISYQVLDNHNMVGRTIDWVVAWGRVYKYDIDHAMMLDSTATKTTYGHAGAEVLKDCLYLGKGSDGTAKIGKLNIGGGSMSAWDSAHFTPGQQTDNLEMVKMYDKIYGCNKDRIFSISDSVTFDASALLLESHTTAISVVPYGETLAIGSIVGEYFPHQAGFHGLGLQRSKLYFWDLTAATFNKDTVIPIEGKIIKLLNKKGVLHAIIQEKDDTISINYYDGNALQPLKKITPLEGTAIGKIGQDAYDIKGDSIYFGNCYSKDYTPKIMQYGKYFDSPAALSNPFIHPSVAPSTVASFDSLKWIKDNELAVAVSDTAGNHTFKRFASANGIYYYNVKTPNLSTGVRQIHKKTKLNFKPLASGDKITIYRNLDFAASWGSIWESVSYARHGAITTYAITKEFPFMNLQYRIDANAIAGDVKLRNVIVDSVDSDEV